MPLYGYAGRILYVNLTTEGSYTEVLQGEVARNYIGGRGFLAWYMWYKTRAGLDPLSPEAPFIIAAGPINATSIPAPRSCVGGKSPHTGLISYSRMGQPVPICDELKKAGYDMLVITGKADKPVYLFIKDGDVEIRDASHLWGKGIYSTLKALEEEVKKEIGDEKYAPLVIGPAGENLVETSLAAGGPGDAAGRHGIGAMMGSKNLKGIVVVGTGEIDVADPDKVRELTFKLLELELQAPGQNVRYGTTYWTYAASHGFSDDACWNYREGTNDDSALLMSGYAIEPYWIRHSACKNCPLHCKKIGIVRAGDYKCIFEGPDYELNVQIGVNWDLRDTEGHLYTTWLVDELGIDGISFGNTIAFLMECMQRGWLTPADLGGVKLTWNPNVKETIAKIAVWTAYKDGPKTFTGEPLGELVGKGVRYIASKIEEIKGIKDVWKYTYQSKGGEYAAHHPRNTLPKYHGYWLGFTYITGNRGGCHLEGSQPWRRYVQLNKDPWPWRSQEAKVVIDSMVGCFFFYRSKKFTSELMAEMLNAVAGYGWSVEDMYTTAERIYNLERCYNIRETGVGLAQPLPDSTPAIALAAEYVKKGDVLPLREFTEPLTKGPGAKKQDEFHPVVQWTAFKRELEEYYKLRGWDTRTGRPTRAKLEELGLKDVADELAKLGLLPA